MTKRTVHGRAVTKMLQKYKWTQEGILELNTAWDLGLERCIVDPLGGEEEDIPDTGDRQFMLRQEGMKSLLHTEKGRPLPGMGSQLCVCFGTRG